jgi:saccharopepsin
MKVIGTIAFAVMAILASGAEAAPHQRDNNIARIPVVKYVNPDRSFADRVNATSKKWGTRFASSTAIPLTDFGSDEGYFGAITLGTPPQKFNVIMDTGSADLWVPASSCTSANCAQKNKFNPAKSSTFKNTKKPFSIQYGTGSVSGNIGSEMLGFGNFKLKQTFGTATTVSQDFQGSPFDGILGLAYNTISSEKALTPFENLVASKSLSQNILGVFLDHNGGKTSEMIFGGTDKTKYTGAITYFPVKTKLYWLINLKGITVGGKAIKVATSNAVIDTGTTLIITTVKDAAAIHKNIPGAQAQQGGTYSVPCNAKIPPIQLNFGGSKSFNINPNFMVLNAGGGACMSGIAGNDLGFPGGLWIVGDVFLKGVYSVFDLGNNRVGFANLRTTAGATAKNTTTPSMPPSATPTVMPGNSPSAAPQAMSSKVKY